MNIWFKGFYFLLIVFTAVHLQYRFKRYFTTYYLVNVTYKGRIYDDDHLFSMMMTGEEFAKTIPWQRREQMYGGVDMDDYVLRGLSVSCEVTKAEYERFRGKLDSLSSDSLLSYPLEELEEDVYEEVQKEIKERQGKYYLVETHFRPGGETVRSEYIFQMMLKDEELEAWQELKPWRPTIDTEDEYYNYEKDFPYVELVCEVTKQEYKRFNKRLEGFAKSQVMYKIQEALGSK